jgi:hypothetical protein
MMQARIRLMSLVAVVAVGLVVLLGATALAQSSNTELGTWKLNVAKSKYSPGTAVKSGTIKVEAAGAGIKQTVDTVSADGTVRRYEYTAKYDGKDSPIIGNSPYGDTIARTRINATTTKSVNKKGGKITTTQTTVVSGDGKTRTVTTKGTNVLGQTTDNVTVWEKQ